MNYTSSESSGSNDSVLMTLLREVAGNFPSCPMLRDNFSANERGREWRPNAGRDRDPLIFGNRGGGRMGVVEQEQQPAPEEPMREPTDDELNQVMSMGFGMEMSVPALQMAQYDIARAIEILITGNEGSLISFAERQNSLKEAAEKKKMDDEIALALKLSMGGCEEADAELGGPVDETIYERLEKIKQIESGEFRESIQSGVEAAILTMLESVRTHAGAHSPPVKPEIVLNLLKTALNGQTTTNRNNEVV